MTIKFPVDENRPFYGKFWPEGVPHQLDYDYSWTLNDLLDDSVKNFPNDPVIWFLDTWVTYLEFKEMVDKFATSLFKLGIRKGDVVAIYLPNSIQYAVSFYGTIRIGAIPSGINPTYKPGEILHQIKMINAKFIVALDYLYEENFTEIIDKWNFEKIIYTNITDLASGLSKLKKWLGKKLKKIPTGKVDHPNAISFLECLNIEPNPPKVSINPAEDAATLIMTGGTTGIPKASIQTHQNLVANAIQAQLFGTRQRDPENPDMLLGHRTAMIGVLPLFHSFALTAVMNLAIRVGGWMILFAKPPSAEELLKQITSLPNPNGMIYCGAEILFQRIAVLPESTISKYSQDGKFPFVVCISSAGPLHDYVREAFEKKTGAKLTELYGLTEGGPGISGNNLYGYREPGYIGVPFPGTDWHIFPADDFEKGPIETLGEEGTGEICACGPQVMKGYLNNPERTKATIKEWDDRKWLLTGDIGFMDEFGRIKIRDRKKQLIKMAGHSVFPAEVETLIGNHPKVLEVAVAGLPDKKTGEAVKAWISLKPEYVGTITAEELHTWCKENITHWKAPKYVEIIEQIPKNIIGKVQRRYLQEHDPLYEGKNK